jgi:ubiquinone biosynthesis accessory factor UbiJ
VFSALDIANHALERERWARDRLAGHAGRTVRVQIGPALRAFVIDGDGRLHDSEAAPDLTLGVSPLKVPALLSQPGRWGELVAAEGDAALAATLCELALTLPWFAEDLFARVFGPVAGQWIADVGRRLLAFPDYAAQRFGDSFTGYVGGEARIVAGAAEARVVANEIAALSTRVDALAHRIDRLDRSAGGAAPRPSPRQGGGRTKRGTG